MSGIDRVFDDFEEISPLWNESEKCLVPLIDVEESEDEFTVTVDLPCVKDKDNISLQISDNSLEIKAVMSQSVTWERWGTIHKELQFDTFKKVIHFPEEVDPSRIKAKFLNSILTVNIPIVREKFKINIE